MDDPSKKREDGNGSSGKLLEPQEKLLCEQIANGEPPHSQRAQALLAIDKGETHAEASRLSGLSAGQVNYWLGRFRTSRMNIFPSESPEVEQQSEKEKSDSAEAETEAKTVKKDKKKDKKGKKKKAKKKDKKGKKKKSKKKKSKKAKKRKNKPKKK